MFSSGYYYVALNTALCRLQFTLFLYKDDLTDTQSTVIKCISCAITKWIFRLCTDGSIMED